ncbi:HAMP domain-containing protein [Methanospirillum lacunae]|nr:HAMP domain-containing protein [Methanospirillum lacunae]
MTISASFDAQREKSNMITLYEERAVSIAKTLDTSVDSEEQLDNEAQNLVNKLIAADMGVYEFSIHGRAPEGITESGYWRLASNDPTIVHKESDPEDLDAIKIDKYNVIYNTEDGKPIIDVTYPLHDANGKPIATAGIKFDMTAIQKQMIPTNMLAILLVMLIIAIIATIIVANTITKPIKQLKDVADRVTSGDFDASLPEASDDEIGELTASIEMLIVGLKIKRGQ